MTAESFPTNEIILQILNERSEALQGTCKIHAKTLDMVCATDALLMCKICGEEQEHRNHSLMSLEDVQQERERKRDCLQNYIEELHNLQDAYLNDAEATEESVLIHTQRQFDKLRDQIALKEQQALKEIADFFAKQKQSQKERLIIQNKKYERKLADLNGNIGVRFFRTLRQPLKGLEKKLSTLIPSITKNITDHFEVLSNSLEHSHLTI
jgi:hypothetical protein